MVFLLNGMVPPGSFQATCVSGAPTGPNGVLHGQQKQNHAQEKSRDTSKANTSAVALGTKPRAIKQDILRGAANLGAFMQYIYRVHTCALYEIAKHTLVDGVCLIVFVNGGY